MDNFVLTVQCQSRRGIVAAIASFLAEYGCNITDSAQFDDPQTEKFFMRITFRSETGTDLTTLQDGFESVAEGLGMEFAFHDAAHRTKVLLMVSNFGHCLNDLLYRC
ncbi:MAG: ACT domain-containing protein, partial [Rhizobium pusense]|nr:ACT domain-containing protein [Agrobacterium pusense]